MTESSHRRHFYFQYKINILTVRNSRLQTNDKPTVKCYAECFIELVKLSYISYIITIEILHVKPFFFKSLYFIIVTEQ